MPVQIILELSSHYLHQNMGLVLSERYYLDPFFRLTQDQKAAEWAKTNYPGIELALEPGEFSPTQARRMRIGGLQPYLIFSALAGASIRFWENHEPAITAEPLKYMPDLSYIKFPDFKIHPLTKLFTAQIEFNKSSYPADLPFNPPLFWVDSGQAFVHAPFTLAYKLRGEQFFSEIYTDPEGIVRLISICTQSIIDLVDHFARLGDRNVTGIHLGDCAASLVSAKTYQQFAIPALFQLIERYGSGRIHSCGVSTHLLAVFAQLTHILEYQLGWHTDLKIARQTIGNVPISLIFPPIFMQLGQADRELEIHKLVEGNGDAPLTLCLTVDQGQPADNIRIVEQIIRSALA